MADYDVGVLGLSSPPPSSVLTPYRPAVSVRNNGIHDALASGTLRIYTAGLLIFTTELYSATIPPGETRNALGTDYWTPPAEGKYLVIADVVCPLDQVESNNHLSPTTVMVLGGPPPPPTTVTPHSSQHEDGGADEVNIDGLHGRLADAQPALAHKATHMVGGSDAISVEGLPGQLSEAQGIRDHAQTHEALGTDRLNVDGLHGQLYNVQKPDVHDNSAHDPNYSINKHGAVDHNADVEAVSRKGTANGYAGLGANGYVPPGQLGLYIQGVSDTDALRKDQSYGPANALAHKTSHQNGGTDELSIAGLSGLAGDPQTPNSTLAHKNSHGFEGGDEMNVGGLHGKLADAQDALAHRTHHEAGGGDIVRGLSITADRVQFNQTSGEVTLVEGTIPVSALGSALHIMAGAILDCYGSAAPNTWTFKLYVDGTSRVTCTYIQAVAAVWEAIIEGHIIQTTATHYRVSLSFIGETGAGVAIVRTGYNINAQAWPAGAFAVKLTAQITSAQVNNGESLAGYISLPSGLQGS